MVSCILRMTLCVLILTRVRAVRLYAARIWEVRLCLIHMTVISSQPDWAKHLNELELNVVDGLIMPNLKMQKSDGRCAFLREDNLCNIHTIRPGICRMFPLGRYWEDETHFKYIVQKGECNKDNLSKIKLKKWLGIEGLAEYDSYIVRWHEYVKQLQAALPGLSEDNVKILNTFNLRVFYMTTYAGCADDKAFYAEFDRRLAMVKEKLGLM